MEPDPVAPDAVDPALVDPAVDVDEPPVPDDVVPVPRAFPIVAFVRIYLLPCVEPPAAPGEDDADVLVEPEPPAWALPSCRQPVTVIVLVLPLLLPLCVVALWAAAPSAQPVAIAIAAVVHA
jgi:hypothetical protein